ncbi:hypothetical protein cce_5040 [Crocosphaera subtropica ATCC 51142]|uniref:Uncharacterized protein n=1 Tax=Crocosphaera subtropica (strain ATCC 51142 / BH68) TaxID=43989 RepID=B1X2M5_CROS5|nr:hypothetical protein [Crocosphaera subtropica]ACB54386.1 hypothetical protein cce_5040 [Crocosphaera subtropica ATCC 51142]
MAQSQAPRTIDVEVISDENRGLRLDDEFKPLSAAELSEKQRLEAIVVGAVWAAGKALRELRDKKLYRDTHPSFAVYCQETFGHSRQKSDYLIVAATIYENLEASGCEVLPKSEFQVRPLGVLKKPPLQVEAWDKAVAISDGKVPRHHIVKKVVREMTRGDEDNPFELGEVVGIVAQDNPELKGKNGCWGIVTALTKTTCDLQIWDTELEGIEIEFLRELEYTEEDCQAIQKLHGRIQRLQKTELEKTAKGVLRLLGKIDRPYLTPLEEEMLQLVEKVYS